MNAVLSHFPGVDRFAPTLRNTQITLDDLNADQKSYVRVHIGEIRLAQDRVGTEIAIMASHFHSLYTLLGAKRFDALVESELGMSARNARRYLHIQRMIETHFMDQRGMVEMDYVSKMSRRAFTLLTASMDDEVIAEIKAIADKGDKVDEETVKQVLAAREQEYEARIAGAEATAERATRELEHTRTQNELESGRLKRQMEVNEELLRRASEQRDAAQREVDELRSLNETLRQQETLVTEKIVEKEVVPAGFATYEEAIAAQEKRLTEAQNRRAQTEQAVAQLEQQRQRLAELQAGADEFQKLREQVEAILLKYPVVRMKAIAASDQTARTLLESLGATMVDLGHQLIAGAK